ncbi:MAG TPA: class II aldolase/adducin family protein [Paraburkholderia sp.]|jgi:ribulose-5-phosphate 4-epimerase/fuculose-1-phosphate aldolase|nr:class II aldolase/adducin family protein [Paraburkholderia sp.]
MDRHSASPIQETAMPVADTPNSALPANPGTTAGRETREQALRIQLAGTYRVFAMLGWTELIYNHITVRVPGPQQHFLINTFGLHYTEVCASNLVKIDLDGNVVSASRHPVNPAGFVVHAALHRALPDAHCVMHTHTTAGLAVACSQAGLENSNFYSAQLDGMVAYHEFEGITVRADEGPRLVASLGEKRLMILRNHGLLAIGTTIAQAFARLWTLNRACEIQLATAALGAARLIADEIAARCTRDSLQFDPRHGAGQDVLDALLRQAERIDPSYKE